MVMVQKKARMLCAASAMVYVMGAVMLLPAAAQAQAEQSTAADASTAAIGDIIVTAQKSAQSINKVGMSISAATGAQLMQRGVTDVSQLTKVVPGFTYTLSSAATPVYSIRGVGFQETTLSASPAVSVYVDEIPLSFPAETVGAAFDLERVEVLKGPQGTLYGQNSTGGAVNYIAAKPTDTLKAGVNASYGRFNEVDLSGFVSGPISDTLSARLAVRLNRMDDWQKSYTRSDSIGSKNLLQGRFLVDWKPVDRLTVRLSLNGWRDHGDQPAGQKVDDHPEVAGAPLPAGLAGYPTAPRNPRAADWTPGRDYRRDNNFYEASGRIDYELSDDVTLSSITAYQHYKRDQLTDLDGMTLENFEVAAGARVKTFLQELRLTGKLPGGNWIVGANYQSDKTYDRNIVRFHDSTVFTALNFSDALNRTWQNIKTYAAYGSFEYEVIDNVKLQGGIRYTQANRSFRGCSGDTGNGELATVFNGFYHAIFHPEDPSDPLGPFSCATFDDAGIPGDVSGKLDQNNISWRAGVNWEVQPSILLYANVSQGYKSGSYPTLPANRDIVFSPVTQEKLIAYETGFKATVLDGTLHVDGALFYYDYKNKQIRGKVLSPPFGLLDKLVNIPKSHVYGFELSGNWRPIPGLTIMPAVTMVKSKIDGTFLNYNPFDPNLQNFGGEAFPYTPKWSGNVDAEYAFGIGSGREAFFGGNVSYTDSVNGAFGELPQFAIPSYTLLDLRAGVRSVDGNWNVMVYGRNVTNKFYLLNTAYVVDATYRFPGMGGTYGVSVSYRF